MEAWRSFWKKMGYGDVFGADVFMALLILNVGAKGSAGICFWGDAVGSPTIVITMYSRKQD
jgi:hypothetical protein